jgi:hypothetical protein
MDDRWMKKEKNSCLQGYVLLLFKDFHFVKNIAVFCSAHMITMQTAYCDHFWLGSI